MSRNEHHDSTPETLLAALDADPAFIEHYDPSEIETLPISTVTDRLIELGLPVSAPADLQRTIVEASTPAGTLSGPLTDEEQAEPDSVEKMPLADATTHRAQPRAPGSSPFVRRRVILSGWNQTQFGRKAIAPVLIGLAATLLLVIGGRSLQNTSTEIQGMKIKLAQLGDEMVLSNKRLQLAANLLQTYAESGAVNKAPRVMRAGVPLMRAGVPPNYHGTPAYPAYNPDGTPVYPAYVPDGTPAYPAYNPDGTPAYPAYNPDGTPAYPAYNPDGTPAYPAYDPDGTAWFDGGNSMYGQGRRAFTPTGGVVYDPNLKSKEGEDDNIVDSDGIHASKVADDGYGVALYTLDRDTEPGKSNCSGDCAIRWAPLPASRLTTGRAGWTVITRDDGRRQWALNGKPLYFLRGRL
jgi:hypothetical protein